MSEFFKIWLFVSNFGGIDKKFNARIDLKSKLYRVALTKRQNKSVKNLIIQNKRVLLHLQNIAE